MSVTSDRTTTAPLRVLVVTVAHRGDDARIAHRQIGALVRDGVDVLYVAPPPADDLGHEGAGTVERVVIRRATGRHRARSWWEAHRAVRRARGAVDLVLVHDLEAVLPIRLARPGCPVVWDVHEDLVASVGDRSWVPRPLRAVVRLAVGAVERAGRVGVRLILAETSYAERLGDWPVVPNTTVVPATEPEYQLAIPQYVVYVGRLSRARGIDSMIDLGRDLAAEADVVLVGTADPDVRERLEAADAVGNVRWLGPLPNPEAMELLAGAVAGLCLLAPLPNYVGSMPTKVYEYSAHGVPAIVSPLPLARRAVDESGAGIVVDPTDRAAVEAAVRAYLDDPARRRREGAAAYSWVRDHHDWRLDGRDFVDVLRGWAAT